MSEMSGGAMHEGSGGVTGGPDGVDDATIAVNLPREVDDATVAVNLPRHADDAADATHPANPANSANPAGSANPTAGLGVDAEATRIAERVRGMRERSGSEAMPVEEPAHERPQWLPTSAGAGLDPTRPIATAPGVTPWELPQGERGLMQGLPVSYVARPQREMLPERGEDEVHRRVGPAPAGHRVAVREGRDALPSLERRDRRRRVVTLIGYAAVVVVCVFGLYAVAATAFGW